MLKNYAAFCGARSLIFQWLIVTWMACCFVIYTVLLVFNMEKSAVDAIYLQTAKEKFAHDLVFYIGNAIVPIGLFAVVSVPLFILAILTIKHR